MCCGMRRMWSRATGGTAPRRTRSVRSRRRPVSDRPTIAVITVSYNVRDELDACLRSLAADRPPLSTAVTGVDNGSTDGTLEMLRARWPDVQLIAAGTNLGFGPANNLGVRRTPGEFVLLLNPDTIVAAGAIGTLVDALRGDPHAA